MTAEFDRASRWMTAEFEQQINLMVRSVAGWGAGSLKGGAPDQALLGPFLNLLAKRSPNLEVLSIGSSCSQNVTDTSMFRIALSCPMLRELDISNGYKIPNLIIRNLKTLFDSDLSAKTQQGGAYIRDTPVVPLLADPQNKQRVK